MCEFLKNGAPQTTPCTPPSLQRGCSLDDRQPSRAGVCGAAEAGGPLRCGRGVRPWLGLWKEQGGGPAPPRPSRRPPTRPGRGAAGRATRSSSGSDPDDAPAPSLRHPAGPRAPERLPEAALQVKAGSVVGVRVGRLRGPDEVRCPAPTGQARCLRSQCGDRTWRRLALVAPRIRGGGHPFPGRNEDGVPVSSFSKTGQWLGVYHFTCKTGRAFAMR